MRYTLSALVSAFILWPALALAATVVGVKDQNGSTIWSYMVGNPTGQTVFPYIALCDGAACANIATIKPASTAAAATDTALVVAQSPNSLGCDGQPLSAMHYTPISLTASAQIVTGATGKQTYVCAINLVAPNNAVALVEGTGTICATGIAGMAGGTTAATGWVFNNSTVPAVVLSEGDGKGSIAATATAADNVCLLLSAATQVSGTLKWYQN